MMHYTSTRDKSVSVAAAQAITQGISKDGGLFVPETIPTVSRDEVAALCQQDYIGRAQAILSYFLDDFTQQEIRQCVTGAYGNNRFSHPAVAPVVPLSEHASILELWHGPTCAFKDMALQLLPRLMPVAAEKSGTKQEIIILVATSGDTGKAALEGFQDVPGTRILVFYPQDGVSHIQKLQMVTQEGNNVGVCAVSGNFDDAQTGVKQIFTDERIAALLAEKGMAFSSANSINWGRLVPQIVYYFSAYCDLVQAGTIQNGDKINFVVPTGNFGNILAAYFAREMGLPVNKLICASNANCVLTEFIQTGVYNRKRDFFTTISPSMDILISSNLERLLYLMSGNDSVQTGDWMQQLQQEGQYRVTPEVQEKIADLFAAGYCDDKETKETIAKVFREQGYLCDPHTAVGVRVYTQYCKKTGDETQTVIASTANPYKFCTSVVQALTGDATQQDEFAQLKQLEAITKTSCPAQLATLQEKPVRFASVCTKDSMEQAVFTLLQI